MSTEKKEISSSEIITGGVNPDVDNDNNLIGDIFLSDEFDYSCGELFNPNNNNDNSNNNSSIFPPKFISQSQLSYSSPSDCSFDDDHHALFSANAIATENCLSQASFILEYQQLYNCYTMCLTTLQDSVKEVEALRDENESLRVANAELLNRLSLFSNSTRMMSSFAPNVRPSSASLVGEFSRLGIGSAFCESNNGEEFPSVSPTSVIEPNQFVRGDPRVSMPKSISVRSKGYLKSVATTQRPTRQQKTNQRVRVAGEKKAGEGMEFEVYNQGMSKTELCNKWQETGACPYGDNCHFAHGISELRPVIRHPRYKTEVCRMVLAGNICPYGHRCHFRHSLTNKELLMGVNRS